MSKWDARNRGRSSHFTQPTAPRLSYVPIVRGAVLDKDEWTELRKNGLAGPEEEAPWDPTQESDEGGIDLPIPDGFEDDDELVMRDAAPPSAPAPILERIANEATSVRMSMPAAARASLPAAARTAMPAQPGPVSQPSAPRAPRDTLDLANVDERPSADALPVPELESSPGAPPPARVAAAPVAPAAPNEAQALVASLGQDAALAALETLCAQTPEDVTRRSALLQLCVDLSIIPKVIEHAGWLVHTYASTERPTEACQVYLRLRERLPALRLREATLVEVLDAAHAAEHSEIVVDATKQLVHHFPASKDAARALATTAGHQLAGERADLARQTLQYLVSAYPNDGWAAAARRKLAELGEG